MPVANQDQVKGILADFEARIRSIIDAAWQEWLEHPNRSRYVFPKRMRAQVVFDAIARLALEEFDGDQNIHVILKKQTVHFLFKDQVLVRFKKGNSRGVGSNIVTQAVLDFVDPQRSIPDLLPDILRVEICWTPDDIGVSLDEVAVVARDRSKRIWAYPLGRHVAGASAEIIPLPSPQSSDDSPPAVLPRRDVKKDSKQGE